MLELSLPVALAVIPVVSGLLVVVIGIASWLRPTPASPLSVATVAVQPPRRAPLREDTMESLVADLRASADARAQDDASTNEICRPRDLAVDDATRDMKTLDDATRDMKVLDDATRDMIALDDDSRSINRASDPFSLEDEGRTEIDHVPPGE
jgi:hypothetical protein